MSMSFGQIVEFPGVTAAELFRTYLSSDGHSAALGAPAEINPKVGGAFRVFGDDAVSGSNLVIEPDTLIVQRWRGQAWGPNDQDSILVLRFDDTPIGATITLSQVNVPDRAYALVNADAWTQLYWDRWKAFFAGGVTTH